MTVYADVLALAEDAVPAGNYPTPESEPPFAKLVRSASFILTENNPFSYEKIRLITPSTFWDAYIFLAAQRKSKITAILKNADKSEDLVSKGDHSHLYNPAEVVGMMTPNEGDLTETDSEEAERYNAYGGGIQWYIAKLVAAHLIRNIPLNTSSIKQVDIADNLEEQAYKGLERIVDLTDITLGGTSATEATLAASKKGQVTLYIAHDIDKETIPEVAFNIPDENTDPATFLNSVNLGDSVELMTGVEIPDNHIGFCYFYMTGQAYNVDKDAILAVDQSTDSRSVSYKIEDAFEIPNGSNIDEIIMMISDNINEKTLTQLAHKSLNQSYVGNILVAPERGRDRVENLSTIKRICYPDTNNFKNRVARFKTAIRVNKLSFDTRRLSVKSNTELLTIAFYTAPANVWNSYIFNSEKEGAQSSEFLPGLRSNSKLGIKGLIFGQQNSYEEFAGTSPFSVLLNVDKGNVIPVSIKDDVSIKAAQDPFGAAAELSQTDTFYFSVDDCFNGFSTYSILFRVSTTNYLASTPVILSIDLQDIVFNKASDRDLIGEKIAQKFVDTIYEYTRGTNNNDDPNDNNNVLGVLLGEYKYDFLNVDQESTLLNDTTPEVLSKDKRAGRVQIVGFRYREQEYKIVVDILSLPKELYLATGNYLARRTLWVKGKPRSITVETKILNTSAGSAAETEAETLASVHANVSETEASISPILQRVYDKQRLLNDARKGYPRKWHS